MRSASLFFLGGAVLVFDRGVARGRAAVPGNLDGPVLAGGGDDQLVAVEAGPDPGVDQLVRNRIAHSFNGDSGLPVHSPRGAERVRERLLRQRMEPLQLFEQGLGGAS